MDRVASGQTLGEREEQEDKVAVVLQNENAPDAELLLLLSDGMGGHAGGEIASQLAISTFINHFQNVSDNMRPRGRLEDSLHAANTAIAQRVAQDPALKGMGCTLVVALVVAGRIVWCSVGDSVLFLLRNGQIQRLNADHSYFGELLEMVERGELTHAEAEAHPRKNALRSAMTGEAVKLIDTRVIDADPKDILVLASDGLETISDEEIARIVYKTAHEGAQKVTDALLEAVADRARPRQDNTSVVVLIGAGEINTTSRPEIQWSMDKAPSNFWLPVAIGAAAVLGFGLLGYLIFGGEDAPEVVDTPMPVEQIQSPEPTPILDDVPEDNIQIAPERDINLDETPPAQEPQVEPDVLEQLPIRPQLRPPELDPLLPDEDQSEPTPSEEP